ncbi:MAG: hypothetical protein PWQ08_701 [Clostridiales bacterium]|jgi:hypothetical protein|nr:hypothetical protein [Clostridiales bacterium]
MMAHLISFGLALVAVCSQHVLHELSHAVVARLFGVRVTRIQWLTYHGGTRVFYEDEPDLTSDNISKKWAFIAGAGFLTTTTLGYFFTAAYFLVPNNTLKIGLCFFSIIFLFVDSLYFLIGSIGDFGDVVGIRKIMKLPKKLTILICTVIFLFHLAIILRIFYFPA